MEQTKYWLLTRYLENCGKNELSLTFEEIEGILGFELPQSARDHAVNWSNTKTLRLPLAWLNAGYRTHNVNLFEGKVHFTKSEEMPTYINASTYRKEKNEERLHPDLAQKDEIILHLTEKGTLTQRELSIAMYGDGNHQSNINESLQSLVRDGFVNRDGERPAYYSLSGNEVVIPNREIKERQPQLRLRNRRENIPNPTVEEVKHWLDSWDKLEDYESQERAVNRVFRDYCSNNDLENILIKCSVLNDFYSTNIFKIYPVAKHILSLNIDARLKAGDPTLVDDIAKNDIGGKMKNFYSFASKYCSHHNQLEFPIYDSYVHKVLKYFLKVDRFSKYKDKDLKEYSKFKQILINFRKFYSLEQFSLKELDKYLWQFGKKYFPKKYRK